MERDEEVVRLYVQEGLSVRGVGVRLGISSTTVLNILRRAGVSPRPMGKHWGWHPTDLTQRNEEIARLYVEEGLSLAEIGGRFGLKPPTVFNILRKGGAGRRRPTSAEARLRSQCPQHLGERNQEIVRLYVEEGRSLAEVGDRFGLSEQQVRHILEKAGIARRGPGLAKLSPEDMCERNQEIVRLYVEEGLSLSQVGARVGLTHGWVRQILDTAGVSRRRPGPYRSDYRSDLTQRNREIARLYLEEGLPPKEIGARIDLSRDSVYRILKRLGVRRSRAGSS